MDLKKAKRKKKPSQPFFHGYNTYAGMHVYRSEDKNAPFSEWTRLTERPQPGTKFTDHYDKDDDKTYYYKITQVDIFGKESLPRTPEKQFWLKGDEKIERKPESDAVGINCYWSEDPDLPLDQWTKLNKEVITGKYDFASPVKTPFYMYSKYVNELGSEFGLPSEIQRVVPIE